ncbi:MAG: hypothetical protein HYS87_03485 [Candidatus Colwellbacteria bacterium]|nr:hypothetical protein [Candidatus Colwellbacteria bacterium]
MQERSNGQTNSKRIAFGALVVLLLASAILLAWIYTDGKTSEAPEDARDASFTDIFSSATWINMAETTMRHDPEAMAFISPGQLVSANLNTYGGEVRSASIDNLDFTGGDSDITLELSNDGATWHSVKVGERVVFPNTKGRAMLWRIIVEPSGDASALPILHSIAVLYNVIIN